jgi:hypothetical protein
MCNCRNRTTITQRAPDKMSRYFDLAHLKPRYQPSSLQLATGTSLGFKLHQTAMSCSRRPQLPIRIASAPRWRPARRAYESAAISGPSHGKPRNDKRPTVGGGALAVRQSYGSTTSCSPIQMDVKPVGADSRRFPLSDPYPLLITATRARMTGCAARCRVARHREARYHRNLHQDEFGPTRAERMQARAGDAPSNPRSSAPIIGIRNSLQIPCSSLKNPC